MDVIGRPAKLTHCPCAIHSRYTLTLYSLRPYAGSTTVSLFTLLRL